MGTGQGPQAELKAMSKRNVNRTGHHNSHWEHRVQSSVWSGEGKRGKERGREGSGDSQP